MAKDNTFSGMAHNALTAETTIVGKIVSQKDIIRNLFFPYICSIKQSV